MQELGRRHKPFASRGFEAGMLVGVDRSILSVMRRRMEAQVRPHLFLIQLHIWISGGQGLDEASLATGLEAWRKLSARIIVKMIQGFNE